MKTANDSLRTLFDEEANLTAQERDLEKQLAEIQHRKKLDGMDIAQLNELLKKDLNDYEVSVKEQDQYNKEAARQIHTMGHLVRQSSYLERDLSIFERDVKNLLNGL